MKLPRIFWKSLISRYGITSRRFCIEQNASKSVKRYVFVSESEDIFENLALEDWLYENYILTQREILLLWRNNPAIVIGRHQNPWLEANIEETNFRNIPVVRRNSGGGAVYHDLGNLNLSFLTCRDVYNRVHNLEVITRSLKKEWNIDSKINSRSDILIRNKKVSGTASKLSRKNAYHHCTLLVDINKNFLSRTLRTLKDDIVTKATVSKPAPTMNLRELNPSINIDRLITVIGLEFLSNSNRNTAVQSRGFHFVNPTNKYFSGLDKKINQFKSWEWIYGRTPKFKATSELHLDQSPNSQPINIEIEVESAIIKNINMLCSPQIGLPHKLAKNMFDSFLKKNYSEIIMSQVKELYLDHYYGQRKNCEINSVSK